MEASMRPVDAMGNPLGVGSLVTVPPMPTWLIHDLPSDDVDALRQVEGSVMQIVSIDDYGFIWFGDDADSPWFCLRPTDVTVAAL